MWMQLRSGGTPILSSSKPFKDPLNNSWPYEILHIEFDKISYKMYVLRKSIIHYYQEESGEMCEKIAGGALRVSLPDILVFLISAASFSTTNT